MIKLKNGLDIKMTELIQVKAFNQINKEDFDVYINCTSDKPFFEEKFNYRIAVEDNGDERQYEKLYEILIDNYCEIFKKLDDHLSVGKKCCIFCRQGRQRSCAVYVCYLIYKGWEIEDAVKHLKYLKKDAFFGNVNFISTINKFKTFKKNHRLFYE